MMRSSTNRALLALGLVAGAAAIPATPAGAQESTTWNWNGDLAQGRTVFLRNVNGDVRFVAGTGNKVEVTAVKRWRRGDPQDVRVEARTLGGDIVICALWGERATCDRDGYHGDRNDDDDDRSWRHRNNDVSVEFTVRIPAHARVEASTVNGEMRVEGTNADIEATTVNGDVEALSNGGRVEARTVNGGILVRTTATGTHDLEYTTVNGSITIELPANSNVEVNLSVLNGRISSDFPLTLNGDINPRRIRASIGNGGARLRANTVNGSIRIRKL